MLYLLCSLIDTRVIFCCLCGISLLGTWQFQPVMVKKDEDQRPDNKNSSKAVSNGSAQENLEAVDSVESSSAAASPQASV